MLRTRGSRTRSALAALAGVTALVLTGCTSGSSAGGPTKTVTASAQASGGSSTASGSTSTSASPTAPPAMPVHIKLLNSDGSTYGVGMPVIAYFSKKITSGKALQTATKATVNGKPITGAWYFEYSSAGNGPIEAHWRPGPQLFWPAHARIHLDIPAKGLSAGPGLAYDDSLTLDFATGPRNISIINDATHKMTVTSDGHQYGVFPVSLGSTKTPTKRGIKVIMEKGRDISMRGPGYFDKHVKWTQRLTYGGEYLHSAPWNTPATGGNIGRGDSSNGCTNLLPADAQKLYGFFRIGDVFEYPNTNGPPMSLGAGYGDWNLSWSEWQTGGLVSTTS